MSQKRDRDEFNDLNADENARRTQVDENEELNDLLSINSNELHQIDLEVRVLNSLL